MFGRGTILAVGMVVLTLVVCRMWVAPKLTKSVFWTSAVWGVLGLVGGQLAQASGRGPLWMQYWLQDFAYTPWATTLFIGGLSGIALLRGKEIPATKLIAASAVLGSFSGFATEIWDTYEALQLADSFMSAIDVSDYGAFAWGAAVTCTIFAKRAFMGMES